MTPVFSDAAFSQSRWQAFGDFIHRVPQVRLCSSGSAGIELALRGAGVTGGTEVVVAAYDYPGNFRTIELIGARPVLADVRGGGVTMDPDSLRSIEGPAIKAVVVSHLYGTLADIISIREICNERDWILIEDACQVPGAGWRIGGTDSGTGTDVNSHEFLPVGSLADVSVLSFGGSKLLSAGNGGAVVTRNDRIGARINAQADRPSDVFAFSPLQCAALLPQLTTLPSLNRRRADGVSRLTRWDWGSVGATAISGEHPEQVQAYYKFAITVENADAKKALIDRFGRIRLPIGEGFRSMHATSDRRSRKPVPLDHSRMLGQWCLVIDHRALLADDLMTRLG